MRASKRPLSFNFDQRIFISITNTIYHGKIDSMYFPLIAIELSMEQQPLGSGLCIYIHVVPLGFALANFS